MVMEYVEGESLYQLVKGRRGGPLRVPDAARYFLQVLDGLGAAHAGGLIHRDIKPSNLMVTPDGGAVILDLGLARASGEASALTLANVVIGTLDYASPEQLGDASKADPRSDLYSLGCTLYFALAGRPPFEGGDMVNKIFKHRMEDPEPLERVARGVPAAFARGRPEAHEQGSGGPPPVLPGAEHRPGPLDRPGEGPRPRGGRGRVAPDIPPAPSRARGRRPPPPDRRRRSQLARHLVAFPGRCRARRGARSPSAPPLLPGPTTGVPRTTRGTRPPPPPPVRTLRKSRPGSSPSSSWPSSWGSSPS